MMAAVDNHVNSPYVERMRDAQWRAEATEAELAQVDSLNEQIATLRLAVDRIVLERYRITNRANARVLRRKKISADSDIRT